MPRQSYFISSVIISKAASKVYDGQLKKIQRQVDKQRKEVFLNLTKKNFTSTAVKDLKQEWQPLQEHVRGGHILLPIINYWRGTEIETSDSSLSFLSFENCKFNGKVARAKEANAVRAYPGFCSTKQLRV